MVLGFAGLALGALGPGRWSLDQALGIRDDLTGAAGLLLTAALGLGGALVLLAATWRPEKQ
jgi:putative oxidoreductase